MKPESEKFDVGCAPGASFRELARGPFAFFRELLFEIHSRDAGP
jgi:hypothetical protein